MGEDKQKILINTVSKRGVSRTIASEFGFGSWTFGETSIELQLDPPIDITTQEGQQKYQKIMAQLFKMCHHALEKDIDAVAQKNEELNASIARRKTTVRSNLEG